MSAQIYCPLHPKYRAKRAPRAHCTSCRVLYALVNAGHASVTAVHTAGPHRLSVKAGA
jgi:hypothetical protein